MRDNGPGMSEHAVKHAFDPLFSHKAAGRQAGLGLPTARRLVELHGGTMSIESAPGAGTRAVIRLPVRAPSESADSPAQTDQIPHAQQSARAA